MHVNRSIQRFSKVKVGEVEKLFPGQYPAGMGAQGTQQVEFCCRELNQTFVWINHTPVDLIDGKSLENKSVPTPAQNPVS